jgi:hypothetical protein
MYNNKIAAIKSKKGTNLGFLNKSEDGKLFINLNNSLIRQFVENGEDELTIVKNFLNSFGEITLEEKRKEEIEGSDSV